MCIEFKSRTNNYKISEAQLEIKKRYKQNGYRILISNDYDEIIAFLNKHMWGVRIPCRYCANQYLSKNTCKAHLQSFHKKLFTHWVFYLSIPNTYKAASYSAYCYQDHHLQRRMAG